MRSLLADKLKKPGAHLKLLRLYLKTTLTVTPKKPQHLKVLRTEVCLAVFRELLFFHFG